MGWTIRNRPGRRAAALLGLFVALAWSGKGFAADDDFFLRQEIDIPGVVLGCRSGDVNGDGRPDLIIVASDQSGHRVGHVYLQREAGRFPPAASQTLTLSSSTDMVQIFDLDRDGKSELLTVDQNGLWQYHHDGAGFATPPQALAAEPTIFMSGIEGTILPHPFVQLISGRTIAFLPTAAGYALWEYKGGTFKKLSALSLAHALDEDDRPVKLYGSAGGVFTMTLPEVTIADSDGDKRDDIYMVWPDRLAIFRQNADGSFGPAAAADMHLNGAHGNFCQSRLADFDRDGKLDFICGRSLGGVSGAHTEIDFYTADRFTQNAPPATQHVSLTDVCGNILVDNIDRTGGVELVVPAIELGIMSTVRTMISKSTDFYLLIYPIDNLGRPSREPAVRKKLSCQPNFENANPTARIRVDWSGDYDGDGLPDLAFADGAGQLQFYRGMAGEYMQGKASLVIDLPDPNQIIVAPLNDDGRSDLIIIHHPGEKSTRVTLLVTNRTS